MPYSFDQARIDSVLSSFQNQEVPPDIGSSEAAPSSPREISLLAECISVTVENSEVCVNLPLGLGTQCVEVPDWVPNGEAARVCLSIKYKEVWGVRIPIGVIVCIYVGGIEVTCVEFGL